MGLIRLIASMRERVPHRLLVQVTFGEYHISMAVIAAVRRRREKRRYRLIWCREEKSSGLTGFLPQDV